MIITTALDALNRHGKTASARLVYWTGKAPAYLHPKHLVPVPGHDWYLAHLRPTDDVLDLGCGNRIHTDRAGQAVRSIIGLDAVFGDDITRPLPFPAGSFDAVMLLDVLEHLVPRQACLGEIARVLRPAGRLLVTGPNRMSRWRRRLRAAGLFAYQDPDHKIEYTAGEFLHELEQAGFLVGGLRPIVYDTPWAGVIDLVGGLSLTCYARLAAWKARRAAAEPLESTGWATVAWKP